MTDLLRILSAGASSLAAQTAAAATASHNLENSGTVGYSRQRVNLTASLPADVVGNSFQGNGVKSGSITQARDRFLESQLPAQFANAASSTAASATLSAVSALDPEASGGLGDALSGFYTALRQLSQNPADAGLRQVVVSASGTLALSFNQTRGALEETRTGVDQELAGDVSEANGLAASVASLNGQVRAARAGGAEPNDLLDSRQKAMDRLAEITGAAPVSTSEGDVSLFLPGGAALVTSMQPSTLSAQGDPANAGHLALRLTAGGIQSAVSPGGELGGLLGARDGALGAGVDALDALAHDLAGEVNAAHQSGVDPSGSAGLALFTGVGTAAGAAGRIAVNGAIAADVSLLAAAKAGGGTGDASNVADLIATGSATLSGGLSAASTLAKITSAFGTAASTAATHSDIDTALRDHLTTLREATSGVSVDDELVEMQKAQRAYQAISKVIQASSDMFETLLALKP